jgi:hypothetical protein
VAAYSTVGGGGGAFATFNTAIKTTQTIKTENRAAIIARAKERGLSREMLNAE